MISQQQKRGYWIFNSFDKQSLVSRDLFILNTLYINSVLKMKMCLNLKSLKANFKFKQAVKIIVKIGDEHQLQTQLSRCAQGCYPFMEKHYINIANTNNIPFVQIQVGNQYGNIITQITVFYVKFKQFSQIKISNKSYQCLLHYELKQYKTNDYNRVNESMITEQEQKLMEEQQRLQVFNLGVYLISFAQRIDLFVYLFKKIQYFLLWRDPKITIGVALLLTIGIYYIKISILIGGVALYFGQGMIVKKFQRIHRYDNVKSRILFPQQNGVFLLNVMSWYCKVYESVSQILFNHDKTFLINVIKLICKLSLINILMLYLFNFQLIFIIVLWFAVLANSPVKKIIYYRVKPLLYTAAEEYFKVMDKISNQINTTIKKSIIKPSQEHCREFYYYQYEKWNVFSGWQKNKQNLYDQNYQCKAQLRSTAPIGWAWTTDWKIDYQSGDVDEQGYQYNKFNSYSAVSTLSTVRRRKWKRTCTMNTYL